jgi:hypothetical protein
VDHTQVKWPNGLVPFYKQVRSQQEKILKGTLVSIDPSSGGTSRPGFAVLRAGELITSGEIPIPKIDIYQRLQILYEHVTKLTNEVPDVFAIEMIRGQRFAPHQLLWSVGTTIAAARTTNIIEIPLVAWKAVAKADPHYFKGDAQDAEKLGQCLVLLAQKFSEEVEQAS